MNLRTFIQSIPIAALLPLVVGQRSDLQIDPITDPNRLICENKFDLSTSLNLKDKPINDVITEIAKSFLGTDYTADPIEAPGKEHLIVNLQALDCVTFYENSLVIARCIKKNLLTYDDYKKELQFIRYRKGIIDEYPSRLHYTSDYFHDNEQKDVLKNITKEIGGIKFKKRINFMTAHPESYPKLAEHKEFIKVMQKIEDEMNTRTIYYIPKGKVKNIQSQIKNGDILGVTTTISGLDCSHTGIAIWKKNELYMIHAPSPGKKVQITELPLSVYLAQIKKDSGIIVDRPLEPKVENNK